MIQQQENLVAIDFATIEFLKKIQIQSTKIMSQTPQIEALNRQIESLIKTNSQDFNQIKSLLKKNKLLIYSSDDISKESQAFLIEARKFAELNLLTALTNNNPKQFQLAIDNVKFFYQNILVLTQSSEYHLVTAIHLLFLLSSHKNEEFYAKIQALNFNDLQDKYISYVLLINDAIEEGNYRRVFQLKKDSPLHYFNPFLNRISQTVRIQIAKSAQKSYAELSIHEALKIFQLDNQQELTQFIERYCEGVQEQLVRWVFKGQKIVFQKANKKRIVFNSDDLILTTLSYSHELQKIA